MLRAFVATLLLASAPVEAPPIQHSGTLRDPTKFQEIIPPSRYQGDSASVVVFGGRDVIEGLCGKPDANGFGPAACTGFKDGTPIMVVPNPCLLAERDFYAAIICHEMAHRNGWPATHGD